jgi:hypothetical protein
VLVKGVSECGFDDLTLFFNAFSKTDLPIGCQAEAARANPRRK